MNDKGGIDEEREEKYRGSKKPPSGDLSISSNKRKKFVKLSC